MHSEVGDIIHSAARLGEILSQRDQNLKHVGILRSATRLCGVIGFFHGASNSTANACCSAALQPADTDLSNNEADAPYT